MKKLHYIFLAFLLVCVQSSIAQNTTVVASSYDISDNLDLRAVASIFGSSKDLADFEYRLNDPNSRISNLDLNGDGYVDYLRVVELVENNTHIVVVQAVMGQNQFQDVATIEVERKKKKGKVNIQIIGNPYFYGSNYIYEPTFVVTPPVFGLFWNSGYSPYYSSWGWNYYPSYFYYYSPYATHRYVNHVHIHINTRNTYAYHPYRYSSRAEILYNSHSNNYYANQHPSNSFRTKYSDLKYSNRYELNSNRPTYNSNSSVRGTAYTRPSNNGSSNSSYTRPSNNGSSNNSYTRPSNNGSSNNSYTRPSNNGSSNSSYTRPSNNGSSNNSYTRPSNNGSSNSSYTRPSNSGSSNNSYTRPSNSGSSNNSYTRPSNSGSSNSSYTRPSNSGSSNSSYRRTSNSGSSNSSYSRPSSNSSSSSSSNSSSRTTYSR